MSDTPHALALAVVDRWYRDGRLRFGASLSGDSNSAQEFAEDLAVALADAGYVVVRANRLQSLEWVQPMSNSVPSCLTCGVLAPDPLAGCCSECGAEDAFIGTQWLRVPTDLLPLADAGYVVVTEASLARALALAEVGCWANPPIHGPEQDAEVHQRDAAAVMGRLRE